MKTYLPKEEQIKRDYWLVDANGKTLGRLASKIAYYLRGKHKPDFTPHLDNGDFIIVINADKIKVTGNKLEDKKYFQHSGYIGGMKITSLDDLLKNYPERVIEYAVKGMLPKGPLGRKIFKKLKVNAGPEHKYAGQQPTELKV
jgi:large subunit ribosomal protein L13